MKHNNNHPRLQVSRISSPRVAQNKEAKCRFFLLGTPSWCDRRAPEIWVNSRNFPADPGFGAGREELDQSNPCHRVLIWVQWGQAGPWHLIPGRSYSMKILRLLRLMCNKLKLGASDKVLSKREAPKLTPFISVGGFKKVWNIIEYFTVLESIRPHFFSADFRAVLNYTCTVLTQKSYNSLR